MKRFLIPAFTVLLLNGPSHASDLPDPEQREQLAGGRVMAIKSPSDQPGGTVRVLALAQAPASAVWEVIVSCAHAFEFVDGLQSCEVIEDSGDRAVVRQVTKQGWPAPTLDYVYESLREPYSSIRFNLVQGNLKAMEGSWYFINTPDGLLLDYRLRIKPDMSVPDFLVSRTLHRNSPDMVACVRGLSGGSGSEEQIRKDLGRCKGEQAVGQ